MYTNYKLKENPSFRMTKEEFNTLVNSLKEEGETKVKVGLVVRTTYSNEVAIEGNDFMFIEDIHNGHGGYFNVVGACQKILVEKFHVADLDTIKNTVLMPVGAFEHEGEIVIYLNLVIKDGFEQRFKTNESINFLPIQEISLNNLDNKSIMVLPTLTIVSE